MVFTYVHICLDHFGYAKSYCGWAHFAPDVKMGVVISFSVFLFLKARFLKEH